MIRQIPLQFEFQTNQNFAAFYAGPNAEIIRHLSDWVIGGHEQQIFIWGETGLGKTHLLTACCQLAKERQRDAFYYAFAAETLPPIQLLDGLDELEMVCLDNIQYLGGHDAWEHALFDFYNRHRARNNRLLISADCPPKYLPIALPDLKTRMSWGLTLKIQALDDQQRVAALAHKAGQMGLVIPDQVGRFLTSHYARDLPSLWRLLEKMDHETLAAQRKLTVPFVKQIIRDLQ